MLNKQNKERDYCLARKGFYTSCLIYMASRLSNLRYDTRAKSPPCDKTRYVFAG